MVNFFTPIISDLNVRENFPSLRKCHNYFSYSYWGGRSVKILSRDQANHLTIIETVDEKAINEIPKNHLNTAIKVIKVASYFAIIVPVLMMIGNFIYLWNNQFIPENYGFSQEQKNKIATLQKQNEEAVKLVEQLKRQHDEVIQGLQLQIIQRESELSQIEQKISDANQGKENLSKENEAIKQQIAQLNGQSSGIIQDLQLEKEKRSKEISDLKLQYTNLNNQKNGEIQGLQQKLSQKETENGTAKLHQLEVRQEIERLKKKLEEYLQQISGKNKLLVQQKEEVEKLTEKQIVYKNQITVLQKQNDELISKIENNYNQQADDDLTYNKLVDENNALHNENLQLQKKIESLKDKINQRVAPANLLTQKPSSSLTASSYSSLIPDLDVKMDLDDYLEKYCPGYTKTEVNELAKVGFKQINEILSGTLTAEVFAKEGNVELLFTQIIWFLMLKSNHLFHEGTFILDDPQGRLKAFLKDKALAHAYEKNGIYPRHSSHLAGVKAEDDLGLDINQTPEIMGIVGCKSTYALPAFKRHILLIPFDDKDNGPRIMIKPEHYPSHGINLSNLEEIYVTIQHLPDTVSHLGNYLYNLFWRFWDPKADSAPGCNKERIPASAVTAFSKSLDAYFHEIDPENIESLKAFLESNQLLLEDLKEVSTENLANNSGIKQTFIKFADDYKAALIKDAKKHGCQTMMRFVKANSKQDSEIQNILKENQAGNDNLCKRIWNEVIFTLNDLITPLKPVE